MPAKRKASASETLDEPDATRRRTRSSAANISPFRDSQPQDPSASRPSSVRRRAPNSSARSAPSPSPTKKAREKLLTRSQAKAPLVQSESSHVGIPNDQEDPRSENELLLSPNRKGGKKKRQETASKPSQLPRVYVEIISPAPHPSKRLQANANADPSSPTPTRPKAMQRIPPSPSRSPISHRKTTANRVSPSKRPGQPASRGTQSSTIQNSSGHGYPPWCLHAQKRSIFHALHDPRTAVFDGEDENGAPSANAVALEQLNALFAGTLERGEGNSCLLIGPRGSGKSRVSIYASGTDTA
jgi:origin recognition complex subunit 4